MKKLTLAERQKLVNEAYEDHAKQMLIEADALLPDEPLDPDVQQALDTYARWLEEDRFIKFKRDVKVACWITAVLVASFLMWWSVHVMNGGSW